MFTCVAARPIVAGPMSRPIRRSPASAQSSRGRKRKPVFRSAGTWTANCAAPPSTVPIDQPIAADSPRTPPNKSSVPARMETALKKADANAGAV